MKNTNSIDLSCLPKKNNIIKWSKSVGFVVKLIYNNIVYDVEIIEYMSKNIKIKINGGIHIIDITSFKKCNFGKIVGYYTREFKYNIGDVIENSKSSMTILEREYRDNNPSKGKFVKWYRLKCNNCSYDNIWMDEYYLKKETYCGVCIGFITVPNINSLSVTNPWMMDFLVNKDDGYKYSYGSKKKVYVKCIDCGKIKESPITLGNLYYNKSIGCVCGDGKSYPEKIFISILSQLNIEFITEFSPKWCKYMLNNKTKKGRYDFYFKINNQEYIVEMDGRQHSVHNNFHNQKLETIQYMDNEKNKLALIHNIKIIRIDCSFSDINYIKNNIIKSELSDILKLNNIDWNKCEEFTLKNIVKELCIFKSNNQNISTKELAKIFNICNSSALKYLKKGHEFGWVEYDIKKELHNRNKRMWKSRSPHVFCDELKKEFNSMSDCVLYFDSNFNIKLKNNNIGRVCRGERKSHKGYHFKYINNNTEKEGE